MIYNKLGIKSRNINLMLSSKFIAGFRFFLPFLALYLQGSLFTIVNVAIIFSIQAIAIILLEIPSGIFADLFGKKRTLVLSYFTAALAVVFLFIGGGMEMFILYAIVSGFSDSMASGTESAIIFDTLKKENKEQLYKRIIGIYYALYPIGAAIGSFIGGYLATVSFSFAVLMSIIPMSIIFLMSLFLREPIYTDAQKISKHVTDSFRSIINNNQIIVLLISGFILTAFEGSIYSLQPIFFAFKQIPILYFGYASGAMFILTAAGYYITSRVSTKIGNKWTLIVSSLFSPILIIIATLLTGFVSLLVFIIPSFLWGMRQPIIEYMINLETDSSKRTTILSVYSFTGRIGLAIFVPFIGYLAQLYTISTAFMINGFALLSGVIVFLFLKEKK